MINESNLKQLHVRVLLKALRLVRAQQHGMRKIFEHVFNVRAAREMTIPTPATTLVPACFLGSVYEEESSVTIEQLKAELATRPHVPNKVEAKFHRRKAAKTARRRGRKDR